MVVIRTFIHCRVGYRNDGYSGAGEGRHNAHNSFLIVLLYALLVRRTFHSALHCPLDQKSQGNLSTSRAPADLPMCVRGVGGDIERSSH